MFNAVAAWSLTGILLVFCGCFGPFDPTDPPPLRSSDDDTSGTQMNTAGLIAWWTCNDSSETRLADSLGTFNGIISDCSVDSGIEGAGLRLNGTSSYISVAPVSGDSSFDFGNGDFTVSVWVQPQVMLQVNDTSRLDIIARGVAKDNGFVLTVIQNRFAAILGELVHTAQNDDFPADAGVWRHVVLTRNQGSVTLYVDNTSVISFDSDLSLSFTQSLPLQIGRDNSGRQDNFYSGLIDEIKILDIAWVASDVAKEYRRFRS